MNDSAVVLTHSGKERAEYGSGNLPPRKSLQHEWQAPGFRTLSTISMPGLSQPSGGQIIGYARGVALPPWRYLRSSWCFPRLRYRYQSLSSPGPRRASIACGLMHWPQRSAVALRTGITDGNHT